jgi:hypothetical protein
VPDDFESECFFIAPIGPESSPERKRSDGVLKFIVAPAAKELNLRALRGDDIAGPGQITLQIIEHVLKAKAVVTDLTGSNPNVYYELAIRHTARLPVVLIAQVGQELPFDVGQMRTIFFDSTDLESAADCRTQIVTHLREAIDGAVDSPVATAVQILNLQGGNAAEQGIAEVLAATDELRTLLNSVHSQVRNFDRYSFPRHLRAPLRDMESAYRQLMILIGEREDELLAQVAKNLALPLEFMLRDMEDVDYGGITTQPTSAQRASLTNKQRDLIRRKRALEEGGVIIESRELPRGEKWGTLVADNGDMLVVELSGGRLANVSKEGATIQEDLDALLLSGDE